MTTTAAAVPAAAPAIPPDRYQEPVERGEKRQQSRDEEKRECRATDHEERRLGETESADDELPEHEYHDRHAPRAVVVSVDTQDRLSGEERDAEISETQEEDPSSRPRIGGLQPISFAPVE